MRILAFCSVILAALNEFAAHPSMAGGCDCRPEISNAFAVTVGNCGKIWSNNECTLKEDGAAGASGKWANELEKKLTFKLDLPQASSPKFSNRQFNDADLYSAIASLATEQNLDFVASSSELRA